MDSNSQLTWSSSIREELDFWRRWLTEDQFKADRDSRFNHNGLGIPEDLLTEIKSGDLHLLDVGSGPFSTLGRNHPRFNVELILADPLGDAYNSLIAELELANHSKIINVSAEELTTKFAHNSFDIVHSANALDHAYDPLLCIQNMLKICKPGGWVYIISVEDEGERQNYTGLHQWNFALVGDKVRLWNKSDSIMLHENLNYANEFHAKTIDHGNSLPMFELLIKKDQP